jgi:biopolymer transport protein ExbD
MINVVFLLLIFFLMTSQLAPPAPVEVTAPTSAGGGDPVAETRLFLDSTGILHFQDSSGHAALDAIGEGLRETDRLLLTADKGVEAARLAAVLRQLAATGPSDVEFVVRPE